MGAAVALLKQPIVWITLVAALALGAGYVWQAPKYSMWKAGQGATGIAEIDRTTASITALEKDRAAKDKAIAQLSTEIAKLRQEAAAHQAKVAVLQSQIDANQAARASVPAPKSLRDVTEALRALYP